MIINHLRKRSAATLLLTLLLSTTLVLTACGSKETDDTEIGNEILEADSQYVVEENGKLYVHADAVAAAYDIRSYYNGADKMVVIRDEENQMTMIMSPAASMTNTGSVIIDEATNTVTDNQPWTYKVFGDAEVHIPAAALEEVFGKTDWQEEIEEVDADYIAAYYLSISVSNTDVASLLFDLGNENYSWDQSGLFTALRNYENAKFVEVEGTIDGEYVDASAERDYLYTEYREFTELYDEDYMNVYNGARVYKQGSTPSASIMKTSFDDGSESKVDGADSDGFHPYNSFTSLGIDGIKKYWVMDIERLADPEEGVSAYKITKVGSETVDIELHHKRSTDKIVRVIDKVEHNGETITRDLEIFY